MNLIFIKEPAPVVSALHTVVHSKNGCFDTLHAIVVLPAMVTLLMLIAGASLLVVVLAPAGHLLGTS